MADELLNEYDQKAKAYVDAHKHEPNWALDMMVYYTNPKHPCRLHLYTYLVVEHLSDYIDAEFASRRLAA